MSIIEIMIAGFIGGVIVAALINVARVHKNYKNTMGATNPAWIGKTLDLWVPVIIILMIGIGVLLLLYTAHSLR